MLLLLLMCADRGASKLFFTWLRGLARLCTYVSSLLSVISGALSFTVSNTLSQHSTALRHVVYFTTSTMLVLAVQAGLLCGTEHNSFSW